jgi:hypothetical protein
VKLPGHGGVPDFRVVDTKSGRTTTSSVTGGYSPGWYTLGGLTGSTRITFEKAGFEPAEIVVTGPALNGGGEVKVQQIYRIAAGERVQTTIAPHDVEYAIGPSESCVNCRMIRVVTPAPGTLHLTLTSNMPRALTVWVNGRRFVGLPGGPLEAAVPVSAGEVVLYAGGGPSEDGVYVPLTLTTSFTGAN